MAAIFLVFLAICIYAGFTIPRIVKKKRHLKNAQEELIRAKIRAENFKKKIKAVKSIK